MNYPRLTAIAVFSVFLSACSSSTPTLPSAGTIAGSAANSAVGAPGSMDAWHQSLAQNKLPSAGCFEATYPSTDWTRVACVTPPHVYFPLPRGVHPKAGQTVGDGNDFTADTTPHVISTAIGSFPKVSGVKSIQSGGGENTYSLQLNSNFFQTKACASIANCVGWSQFVFENGGSSAEGYLFIQDWLVATQGSFASCPPNAGWENLGIGCVQNSPYGVSVPTVPVSGLGSIVVTGDADKTGDSIYIAVGKKEYGMKNVQGDGITDLSENWQGAEYNILGDGGGDQANFNSGSKITVSIQADDGVKKKPTCPSNSGTTAETNNLFFVKAPAKPDTYKYPSIEFNMSSKQGPTPTCDASKGTG